MASKVLLEHYKGLRELNREDLIFMLSHIFNRDLEIVTPQLPDPPKNRREFWEYVVDKIVHQLKRPSIEDVIGGYIYLTGKAENYVMSTGYLTDDYEESFTDIYLEFWNYKFPDNELDYEDIDYEDFR